MLLSSWNFKAGQRDNFAFTYMEIELGCAKPKKVESDTEVELTEFIYRMS